MSILEGMEKAPLLFLNFLSDKIVTIKFSSVTEQSFSIVRIESEKRSKIPLLIIGFGFCFAKQGGIQWLF